MRILWVLLLGLCCSCSLGPRPGIPGGSMGVTTNDMDTDQDMDIADDGPSNGADGSTETTVDLERGQLLYGVYCGFCHGDEGQGYVSDNANALAHPHFQASASDEFIRSSIVNGRPGTPMSAWGRAQGGPLSEADVENVLAYVRTWNTDLEVQLGPDSEGSPARGAAVYQAFGCAGCHGAEGEGQQGDGGALSLNNPWFLAEASDGFIRYAIEDGRLGPVHPTSMPAYRDALTAQQIEDVVALIRSWQRPTDSAPPGEYVPVLTDITINEGGSEPDFELRDDKYVASAAVNAAIEAGQEIILLDARAHGDYLDGHILGAVSMPFYLLDCSDESASEEEAAACEERVAGYLSAFPKDVWIIPYCGCPHAISGQAFERLAAEGYEKIAVLDEGYYFWVEQGYPASGE